MDLEGQGEALVKFVSKWFQVVMSMLNKQNKSSGKQVGTYIKEAVQAALIYLKDNPNNPFEARKANIMFMVDVI